MTITVHIVDDDASVRHSLQFMLESYDFQVQSYQSGEAFLHNVDVTQAGCVILDSSMPGLSGQQVQHLLNEKNSPLSVIYLTGHGDVPMAVYAFKKGAVDFFQKPVDGDVLAATVKNALLLSRQRQQQREYRQRASQLTQREAELLSLIAQGYKNQQVANQLHISLRTVEVHRANLMKKLHAKTVAELVRMYAQMVG